MQKIINDLKLTTGGILEFMILKMLSNKTHSTKEIYNRLKQVGFKIPYGSLYPLLSKFRGADYVKIGREDGITTSSDKTYELTHKGKLRFLSIREDWKTLNTLVNQL